MGKRTNQTRDEHNKWDIGGGGIEFNESVEKTFRKEIMEEYATDVLNFDFLGYREVYRQYQGQSTHWVVLDFKVLVDPAKVKNGEPHKFGAVKWFTLNTLPTKDLLHSQLPYFLEKYKLKLE